MTRFVYVGIPTLYNEQKFVQSALSGLDWIGLDWIGLASGPLSRIGLDRDHWLTDLDRIAFFQMNPFHTLAREQNPCRLPWTKLRIRREKNDRHAISMPWNQPFPQHTHFQTCGAVPDDTPNVVIFTPVKKAAKK